MCVFIKKKKKIATLTNFACLTADGKVIIIIIGPLNVLKNMREYYYTYVVELPTQNRQYIKIIIYRSSRGANGDLHFIGYYRECIA